MKSGPTIAIIENVDISRRQCGEELHRSAPKNNNIIVEQFGNVVCVNFEDVLYIVTAVQRSLRTKLL